MIYLKYNFRITNIETTEIRINYYYSFFDKGGSCISFYSVQCVFCVLCACFCVSLSMGSVVLLSSFDVLSFTTPCAAAGYNLLPSTVTRMVFSGFFVFSLLT